MFGGPLASSSTFAFDASSLADGDFFQTPTILNPLHGATGVALDVAFQWTDPTGLATPDFLEVEVEPENGPGGQRDDSDTGTLLITDTSWQPPIPLADGQYEFDALYLDADSTPFTSAIQVNTGSITWGDSPSAPAGYPATTPLLAIGSEAIIAFTVPEPGLAVLGVAALAVLGLLARSRRRRSAATHEGHVSFSVTISTSPSTPPSPAPGLTPAPGTRRALAPWRTGAPVRR